MKGLAGTLIIFIILGTGFWYITQNTNLLDKMSIKQENIVINTGQIETGSTFSIYCQQKGGTIVRDPNEIQSETCLFPNENICNNSGFLSGECGETTEITGTIEDNTGVTGNSENKTGIISDIEPNNEISRYENGESICGSNDGFYENKANQIQFYYGSVLQTQNVYKKEQNLFFLGRIPAEEGTKGIHLYKYDCQTKTTEDLYNFGGELYANATLDFITEGKLHIYEYYGDSCDILFGKSSIYDIKSNKVSNFNFKEWVGFKEKPGCTCANELDINNGNEAYVKCYCGIDGCPEEENLGYRVKIDIINKKILNKGR